MLTLMVLNFTLLSQLADARCEPHFHAQLRNVDRTLDRTELTLTDLQRDLAELRHSVEAARVRDAAERDAYRSQLAQAFAAGFMTLVIIIVGVELRLRRQQQKELRDELKELVLGQAENLRLEQRSHLDRLKAENARAEDLNREASALASWVVSMDAREKQYNPKYECLSHGSCALPPDHAMPGAAVVVHVNHVGEKFVTRNGQYGHLGRKQTAEKLQMEVD